MRAAFLLLVLGLAAVSADKGFHRIVGGSVTTINNYPSIVSLLYSRNHVTYSQVCGATIINNRAFLSAAHCTVGDAASNWRGRVGSTNANSGGDVYNIARIIIHPSYNTWTLDSDITLLFTSNAISFTSVIQPVGIAGSSYNLGDNQVVWAAGWGTTSAGGWSSEQLRHVQIWTVNQNTCRTRYNELRLTVTDNMLCSGWLDVGGRDQCQGDSGGPLYHNGILVGVCSWGHSCAQARYPGVNARVSRFATWIQSNA